MDLITIEGYQASGKTYYTKRIRSTLSAGHHNLLFLMEPHPEIPTVLNWLKKIKDCQGNIWNDTRERLSLTEEYWTPVLLNPRYTIDKRLLDAMTTFILADGGFLPKLSIWIDCPLDESLRRTSMRDGWDASKFDRRINYPHNAEIDAKNHTNLEAMKQQYDFFRVVDGTRDRDYVFNSIMSMIYGIL